LGNYCSKDSLIAIGDIGVVSFYSKLPIIDLFGLTDSFIAHNTDNLKCVEYVLSQKPKYIILRSKCNPEKERFEPLWGIEAIFLINTTFIKNYRYLFYLEYNKNYYLVVFKHI